MPSVSSIFIRDCYADFYATSRVVYLQLNTNEVVNYCVQFQYVPIVSIRFLNCMTNDKAITVIINFTLLFFLYASYFSHYLTFKYFR